MSRLQVVAFDKNRSDESWNEVAKHCPFITQWGRTRINDGLKNSLKTVVIESDYICKDHRNLFSAFYSKKFHPNPDKTTRLHFFSKAGLSENDVLFKCAELNTEYLGYSVIRPVAQRCIGRSILDPHKAFRADANNRLFCLKTNFAAHIVGTKYRVSGFPYMSQDVDATSCGHTALWAVMRFLSERYHLYRETYPSQIVAMADTSRGRRFPYRSLFYTDYLKILSEFGCHPVFMRTKDRQADEKIKSEEFIHMCSYIESGFPIIASYGNHAVVVIGHTLDLNRTPSVNSGTFIDASAFWKQLIVIDDNFFPYRLLGFDSLANPEQNYGFSIGYSIDSIWVYVCPMPEKAFLPTEIARKVAYEVASMYREKIRESGDGPFVARMFMTTGVSFQNRKLTFVTDPTDPIFDWASYYVKDLCFPHFIWVMELSSLNEYRRGECRAEIVLDATASGYEQQQIYTRIGRWFLLPGCEPKKLPETVAKTTFPQYTHNLGES